MGALNHRHQIETTELTVIKMTELGETEIKHLVSGACSTIRHRATTKVLPFCTDENHVAKKEQTRTQTVHIVVDKIEHKL